MPETLAMKYCRAIFHGLRMKCYAQGSMDLKEPTSSQVPLEVIDSKTRYDRIHLEFLNLIFMKRID